MKKIICVILVITIMGSLTACGVYSYFGEYLNGLDVTEGMGTFTWPKSDIAKLVPVPNSDYGKILWESSSGFAIYVGNTTKEEYNTYVDTVYDCGFVVNYQKWDGYFCGDNADGYSVILGFEGSNTMYIQIDEPQSDEEGSQIPSSGNSETSSNTANTVPTVPPTTTIPSTTAQQVPPVENRILMVSNSADYVGMNPQEVKSILSELGFGNIKLVANVTTDSTKVEGMVASVQAASREFDKGDAFEKNAEITILYWRIVELKPKITMVADSTAYNGMNYSEVANSLRNLGFTNISLTYSTTTDAGKVTGVVYSVKASGSTFQKGDAFDKDTKITITYWKYTEPQPEIVFPTSGTKLAKDLDVKTDYTVYYVNVDNMKNKPTTQRWGTAVLTDGVVEYLNYLESLGHTITIVSTSHREPYSGFHIYETELKASKGSFSWSMNLYIQDEDYVEYEFRINLK